MPPSNSLRYFNRKFTNKNHRSMGREKGESLFYDRTYWQKKRAKVSNSGDCDKKEQISSLHLPMASRWTCIAMFWQTVTPE